MISKELLGMALGVKIAQYNVELDREMVWVESECGKYDWKPIDIHNISHKCKVWAKSKDISLFSGACENSDNGCDLEWSYDCQLFSHIEGMELFYTKCYTEPEAIFKATSYILENMIKDNK